MRPEALRPQTARKAQAATTKLKTRLSKGEKRHRKRLAEVGAVYDLTPVPRPATDVMGGEQTTGQPPARTPSTSGSPPASSTMPPQVLSDVFDEAERRDPTHTRTWVALVDGNNESVRVLCRFLSSQGGWRHAEED
jgi:hypothetical protein